MRAAVEARRAVDPGLDDPFRGLYLGDDDVDRLLAAGARVAPSCPTAAERREQAEQAAARRRGRRRRHPAARACARGCGLDALDVELLLVALAPDIDHRFERLYGYLHDDVTRRRASIGLALELAGLHPADVAARDRLGPRGPLVEAGLVEVDDADRPFLTRALRVPDRVAAHLLGGDIARPVGGRPARRARGLGVDDDGGLGRVLAPDRDGDVPCWPT